MKNRGQGSVVKGQGSGVRKRCIIFTILIFFCWSGIAWATDVNDLIFQGADFHYKGKLDKAIVKFRAATQIDPSNEYAHNQLGILYAKKERFNDAFREFSKVVQIDCRNTYALLWLGILYLRQNDLNNAFEKFQEIIGIDPNNADAYYYLGTIYNFRHNPAKAIEYLKKARDADSGEADTHYRLGKAFHNVDMTCNALLEYDRALRLKPSYTAAINETGWIYYNHGSYEKAIKEWKKTLKINPRDRDAVLNLAKAYNDLAWKALTAGNKKEAVKYWKKTLRVNPGNKAAKYNLKKYGK
jgi:tetratricopeptide (TPR) repeat protein